MAWREFESSPVLGVGADNFVFQYDRFKTIETLEPQQAHSLVLQVLGETGIVGGVFAIGGMILALGGLLWPRCAAGWLGARQTWMRRRTNPADTVASGASSQRNSRWGNNSLDYGWGMAIFTGIVYWLIHASVDWLWQMAGVAIPMLLLLAAGIAGVDGRVDIIWPRLSRWLQFRLPEGARTESNGDARGETTGQEIGIVRRIDKVQETDANQAQTFGTGQEERLLLLARRSEKHLLKRTRRQRKLARTQRNALRFQPPGMLSLTFRILLLTLAFVVIVLAGLPYLSLQYQDSALSLARTNGVRAAARAETAHWLQPSDPAPYVTQARISSSAASTSASSAASDRTGAVLDNLALCIRSFEKAIEVEPADWTIHYRAGVAAINLLLASECATGAAPALD